MVLYTDNKDTRFIVSLDTNTLSFTPKEVDNIPVRLSDFQGLIPLLPMVAYTDGSVYIVVIQVGMFTKQFTLTISPPERTINASWEVVIHE